MTRDDALVESLKLDWRRASLTERQYAILTYCEKVTRHAHDLSAEDLEPLRRQGMDDNSILAVVLIAAFFQMATTIADALGVELDPELTRGTEAYARFLGRPD